ncbi:MAG: hypothetical protein BGN82_02075 [Alphaproteobacteria bacterium 65-7]|nr:MAG: hypothetical protein BGN82_02075 [Alphaproteobacteria bacterium 65-7]
MAAFLMQRGVAETPRHRWLSMTISVTGHVGLFVLAIFLTTAVPKKAEMQTITVSIAQPQVSQPEPVPLPKLERVPEVVMPDLPKIDTIAQPTPDSIRAAPPPASQAPSDSTAKKSDDNQTSPPVFDAGYLNNPAPIYPNMSRRLREVGTTVLRVRVSAAGLPLDVLMGTSSGYSRLDEAAMAAVKKWKFQPAQRNGNAVEAWVLVPVEFSLTRS